MKIIAFRAVDLSFRFSFRPENTHRRYRCQRLNFRIRENEKLSRACKAFRPDRISFNAIYAVR